MILTGVLSGEGALETALVTARFTFPREKSVLRETGGKCA